MIKKIEHFIGGALFTGTSGRDSMVFNPATGTESANVSLADANDVNTAVAAAQNCLSCMVRNDTIKSRSDTF